MWRSCTSVNYKTDASLKQWVKMILFIYLCLVGQQDSTSKISKSDQLNDSIECQQKFFENSTKQVKNGKQALLFHFITL